MIFRQIRMYPKGFIISIGQGMSKGFRIQVVFWNWGFEITNCKPLTKDKVQ